MSFELLDAMAGIKYPERTVTVYTDYAALDQMAELEHQASRLGVNDNDLNNKILAEQAELQKQVEASAININLRGLPRNIINSITKHIEATVKDSVDRANQTNEKIMTRSVVSITNAEGEKADADEDTLVQFLNSLPSNVWLELMKAVSEVNFAAREYEGKTTDPNFS